MLERMYEYYLSQPACMKRILAGHNRLLGRFGSLFTAINPDRIYLIGSGTSLNACKAAREYIEQVLGAEVSVITPSNPPAIRGERPMMIAVSQGGKSSNTIAYLRGLRKKKHPIATFTAGLDVPAAKLADCAVDIGVGDETVGPKTLGYTGTVLCLYLAALEAGLASGRITKQSYEKEIGLLGETIEYSEENLQRCGEFYRQHLPDLKKATHFLFVGKGCSAAVGEEDALKVLETLCYPSAGYEFEEYLHGPACCTSPGTALFLFYSDDEDGKRMQKLADISSRATDNCYIIDRTSSLEGKNILRLRSGNSKYMSPFVDIFFGQLVSALLTKEMGRTRHEAVRQIFSDMDTKVADTCDLGESKRSTHC